VARAQAFASVGELITSGTEIHAAELLLRRRSTGGRHGLFDAGWHVNLQKPLPMTSRARAAWPTKLSGEVFNSGDGELPVYEPLQKLKAVVESGVLA